MKRLLADTDVVSYIFKWLLLLPVMSNSWKRR